MRALDTLPCPRHPRHRRAAHNIKATKTSRPPSARQPTLEGFPAHRYVRPRRRSCQFELPTAITATNGKSLRIAAARPSVTPAHWTATTG